MSQKLIQVHPSKRLTVPNGSEADIDVEMVPLIRALWRMGLTTQECCQDFGESILHGHQSHTSDRDRRHAHFYWGQAWLKMPTDDALTFLNILAEREIFAQRMRRWTHPDAWMNIIRIFPGGQPNEPAKPARLDRCAQLHFPREQISQATEVLLKKPRKSPASP